MPLVEREADLNIFPQKIESPCKHLSVGDLHGNALKLIYILVEEGTLELGEADYNSLRKIYETDFETLRDEDAKERIAGFQKIIAKATVNKNKAITLIGDELADRGNNDYFTLLVLKKLHDSEVNLDVILSNHSAVFIRDYERKVFTGANDLGRGQAQSLVSMQRLMARNLVAEKEVRDLVENCYIPKTKAISYTVSADGQLTLFSHAPIGLETIQALAKKFNIPYEDKTTKALINTIDKINAYVKTLFEKRELAALIDTEPYSNPKIPMPISSPLQRLIWNRAVGDELITETSSGIKINFVHGHIGDGAVYKKGQPLPSHQNLDTSWAKFPDSYKTNAVIRHYTCHSDDLTALELSDAFWTKIQQNKVTELYSELKVKTNELIKKGTESDRQFNSRYLGAAEAAVKLNTALDAAQEQFFGKKLSKHGLAEFAGAVEDAVREANKEFVKHRGSWHGGGNPLVDFVKGFLKVLDAFICLVPNLLKTDKVSFFSPPPMTKSNERLNTFAVGFEELIKEIEPDAPYEDLGQSALPKI